MSNYTKPSISGYNTNPPPDDATTGTDNQLFWSKHKNKLADPIKTLLDSVNDECESAFGKLWLYGVTTITATGNIDATHRDKLIKSSNAITLTLLAAATAGDGFAIAFYNSDSTNDLTIDGNLTETINGSETLTVTAGESCVLVCNGTNWDAISRTRTPTTDLPKGYISGLTLSNASDTDHDITVSAGEARDSTDAQNLSLSVAMTKQIDAVWAAGDAAGGLFSGTVAADTWYHLFLIRKTSDESIDAGFDTSITAANIPSGYVEYRRIGSVLTDSLSNILAFQNPKDGVFRWQDPPLDLNVVVGATTQQTATLTVPTGVIVNALVNWKTGSSGDVYIHPLSIDDEPPSDSSAPLQQIGQGAGTPGQIEVLTNTSGQVAYRTGTTGGTEYASTVGWYDYRS